MEVFHCAETKYVSRYTEVQWPAVWWYTSSSCNRTRPVVRRWGMLGHPSNEVGCMAKSQLCTQLCIIMHYTHLHINTKSVLLSVRSFTYRLSYPQKWTLKLLNTPSRVNTASTVNNTYEGKSVCTTACYKYHQEKFTQREKICSINAYTLWKWWGSSSCKISHTSNCLTPGLWDTDLMIVERLCSTSRKISSFTCTVLTEQGLPTSCLLVLKNLLS